jgi:hypothetical protein
MRVATWSGSSPSGCSSVLQCTSRWRWLQVEKLLISQAAALERDAIGKPRTALSVCCAHGIAMCRTLPNISLQYARCRFWWRFIG